jgi:hypothetical protein
MSCKQHPKEYNVWRSMRQRCYNPRSNVYRYYGGRGIAVCDRWQGPDGFRNFLADLGPQPHARASLHRLDNDGPYAPGNVVWANAHTQSRHRRNNRLLTFQGRTMILADWALALGMRAITLTARLRRGWSVEKALTVPVARRRPYREWARIKPDRKKPSRKPRTPAAPSTAVPAASQPQGSAPQGIGAAVSVPGRLP